MVEQDRPQMTIRRMRIACWINKATKTHSEYVIFIVFPLQQWLHERTSMLRYMYIVCLYTLKRIKSIPAYDILSDGLTSELCVYSRVFIYKWIIEYTARLLISYLLRSRVTDFAATM